MNALSATEHRLIRDSSDEEAWAAYAKELEAAGDARGVLIDHEIATSTGDGAQSVQEFIESNPAEWLNLPAYDRNDEDPGLWFAWKHGFVLSVVVDVRPGLLKWPPLAEQFRLFLGSPAARLLRRIEVRRVENGTDDQYIAKLVEQPRPALRELSLAADDAGTLSGSVISEVERLALRGVRTLKPMTLPRLHHLSVDSPHFSAKAMKALAASSLPDLTTLRITLGAPDMKPKERPGVADVAAVLNAFSRIRALEIHNVSFGDELVECIVGSAVATNLEFLDISRVDLSATGTQRLRDGASRLPSLRTLSVNARALGRDPTETFGVLADRVIVTRPTSANVARHTIAMTAECIAAALGRRGSDQASHRSAIRIRRWASLWFFDECTGIGSNANVAGLGVLAWALKIASEPDEALDPELLLPDVPVERSFDAFLQSACLRDREELETVLRRSEEKLWNDWRAFKDVSGVREQVRALRWLLGAALHWRDVPVHVARHELPPPEAASRVLLSRLDHAWKKLRKKFRQPLPGPLSEEKVDGAEREIGRRFPADLRASFLRHGAESYPPIELLSLDSALEYWRMLDTWTMRADEPVWANEPENRPAFASTDASLRAVKSGGWRRAWFPITSAELDSDFHGADLDPAPDGVAGQVFYWSHEIPGPECIMEPSFVEWLEWAETAEEFAASDD